MHEETMDLIKEIRRKVAWGILTSHQNLGGPGRIHPGKCNAQIALEEVMAIIEREGIKFANEVMASVAAPASTEAKEKLDE